MLRYVLIGGFVLVAGFLGFRIFDLYQTYATLSDVPPEHIIASPEADLSVVEFLDYNCTYCRQAHPTITEAIRQDGKIKYIVRPVAFVDEESETAVKILYAAGIQGKFASMHDALMQNEQPLDDAGISALAAQAGVEPVQMRRDMESEPVLDFISANENLFNKVGLGATPTFVIGGKIVYTPETRMPDTADFISMFNEARAKGLQ